jgi:hypothetical protein
MRREFKIRLQDGGVSAILDLPEGKPKAALTLAHGAGAGMHHKFLADLSSALVKSGFAVLRFQFPYMEAGRKMPDSPKLAEVAITAAVKRLAEEVPGVPLYGSGKSYGCRMTSMTAAQGLIPEIRGIINFGYPLHPANQPGVERAKHLPEVKIPLLFLQGDRDELARLELLRPVCEKQPRAKLHIVQHADHSFAVLKGSGRTNADVMGELVAEAGKFMSGAS